MRATAMTAMTAERPAGGPRVALGGLRVRIVVVFLVLLAVASLVAFLVVRGVLLARLEERVAAALSQEAEELDRFVSSGVDPSDGQPFGADITRLFSVFLQRNVPNRDEALLAYVPASQTFIRDLGEPRIPCGGTLGRASGHHRQRHRPPPASERTT